MSEYEICCLMVSVNDYNSSWDNNNGNITYRFLGMLDISYIPHTQTRGLKHSG